MSRTSWIWAALCVIACMPSAAAVEDDLRAELVGRYALSRGALVSECTDHFTDMDVVGGRLTGGTGSRFEAGELVKIDNVKLGAITGLDVNLTLAEPLLLSFEDGPFTIYDQRRCRVQLNFEVPREVRKDTRKSLAAVAAVLELFDDAGAAKRAGWNQRKVEDYPAGWEKTRREYEVWKVAQMNELVRQKSARLLDEAARILGYMPGDDDYLLSFGAGAKARSDSWSSCEAMLGASFYVSGSGGKSKRGWSDGQLVAWATQLAHALQGCHLQEKK